VFLLPLSEVLSSIQDLGDLVPRSVSKVVFDAITPITTIDGNQFMEHFGLEAVFIALHKNESQKSDSLFVCSPWGSDNRVYMWEGGAGFPTGLQSVNTADVVFTRKQISTKQGMRFGDTVAFPDLNGDGIRDVVIASNRDSSFTTLGGAVDIFLTS